MENIIVTPYNTEGNQDGNCKNGKVANGSKLEDEVEGLLMEGKTIDPEPPLKIIGETTAAVATKGAVIKGN